MRCAVCNSIESKVVDSRPGSDGGSIRRRRECEECGGRFTTYERLESIVPMIVKRDGRRESFDADKIRRALRTACRKRPVSADAIERIVERIVGTLTESTDREAPTSAIGDLLLVELKEVDEVSYARFASVFLRFETLDEFAGLVRANGD